MKKNRSYCIEKNYQEAIKRLASLKGTTASQYLSELILDMWDWKNQR